MKNQAKKKKDFEKHQQDVARYMKGHAMDKEEEFMVISTIIEGKYT